LATAPGKSDSKPAENREFAQLRQLMVERYVVGRGVKDPRVLEAMRQVPRHLFVPAVVRARAYSESALPIGSGQTISQPYIVGRMIELLELSGSEKVLEVGTGTGYQACVLARVAARVFSIERVNELAIRAVALVRELKLDNVSVKVFDGTYGWSDQAPFDRIIVAATAPEVPQPLVAQLARGGTMVIPLGREQNQRLALVRRIGTGVKIEDCGPAQFVPLIGRFGWKDEA
jgi:protein-L-isoaspartate(D-aspartate) O-methyltransferase